MNWGRAYPTKDPIQTSIQIPNIQLMRVLSGQLHSARSLLAGVYHLMEVERLGFSDLDHVACLSLDGELADLKMSGTLLDAVTMLQRAVLDSTHCLPAG